MIRIYRDRDGSVAFEVNTDWIANLYNKIRGDQTKYAPIVKHVDIDIDPSVAAIAVVAVLVAVALVAIALLRST